MQVRPMGAAGDARCGRWAVASAPLPSPGAPLRGRPAAETLAWSWHVMTPSRRAGTAHLMQGRSGSRPPSRRPPGEAEALRRAARPRAEQPGMRGLGVASAASAALERRAGGEGLQRERWGAGLLPCEERNAGEERRGARLCLSTGEGTRLGHEPWTFAPFRRLLPKRGAWGLRAPGIHAMLRPRHRPDPL